ncbi:MAG: hypothetical protein H6581_17810 [Bacteroidia bacterium]|nr:hypothetical protein [Bacteroidia bacterium]
MQNQTRKTRNTAFVSLENRCRDLAERLGLTMVYGDEDNHHGKGVVFPVIMGDFQGNQVRIKFTMDGGEEKILSEIEGRGVGVFVQVAVDNPNEKWFSIKRAGFLQPLTRFLSHRQVELGKGSLDDDFLVRASDRNWMVNLLDPRALSLMDTIWVETQSRGELVLLPDRQHFVEYTRQFSVKRLYYLVELMGHLARRMEAREPLSGPVQTEFQQDMEEHF